MKKVISIITSMMILVSSLSIDVPAFASSGRSIDAVIEDLSELYQDEAESGKELEDSASCRIIVKANQKPDTYGNAEYIKGTDKIYIYQYSDITSANEALEYYKSLSYVQWAETDGVMEGQSLSYGNDMMGSDEAKEYIVNSNIPTEEVNVAVIDSGINFRLNRFANSGRVIDSGVNLSNTGTEGTAQQDHGNYHGSNITSIILDNTTDNVNIIGYKVIDRDGTGSESAVAMGIVKAVEDGADVINLSLGGEGASQLIIETVNEAVNSGVIVVASAGNDGDDVSKYCPAFMEEVFTVGAIDYNGNRAFFSNFGDGIDFVAPGYNVEVQGNRGLSSTESDYVSGTSFSAPYIAAASAMALSVNPDYTPEEVKQKLIDSCVTQNEINYTSPYLKEVEISDNNFSNIVFGDEAESENLFYGYGMPQMQKIVGQENKCNSPIFSVSSGIYHDELELELTAESDSSIYYTTDGTYPSKSGGTLYTEPIIISSTTSIRAIAYSDDKVKSIPSAEEYKMEYYADESEFTIDSRGYITGYKGNTPEIVVPDTINGVVVRGVARNAFFDDLDPSNPDIIEQYGDLSDHLHGIVLPDTVTEIEDNSFFSFILTYFTAHGLTKVGDFALDAPLVYLDAPNIESIGTEGLSTCLSTINLPKLKTAGDSAFRENKYLSSVYLPKLETVDPLVFYQCYRLQTVNLPSVTEIYDGAFAQCHWLSDINVPNVKILVGEGGVVGLNTYLFYSCINLKEINMPLLERTTADNCFNDCISLSKVNFPKLTNITDNMFYFCYNLTDVDIPNATVIDYQAFNYTFALSELFLPSVVEIDDEAFLNSGLESLNAPVLRKLGNKVFAGYSEMYHIYFVNENLNSIYAPNLSDLSDYAFAYTGGITEVNLPSLTTIGENAFYESSVNYLYALNLQAAKSLPVAENSLVVVSEPFTECSYDATNTNLTIQGVKDTYGEEYANKYNLEFIDMDAKGSSIRVKDSGLRFGFSFYDTQDKEVEEYGFVYSYDETKGDCLKVENEGSNEVIKMIAKNRLSHEDKTTTFNLVFTDIPKLEYDHFVIARAYVKIDGKYYYSDILKRSFNEVKNAVLADDEIDDATKESIRNLLKEA